MKIEAITLRELRMPLVSFFETSFGRTTERRILLVEIRSEGHAGWGEVTCGETPFYSHETTDTAISIIRDFAAPMVLGRAFEDPSELRPMMKLIRGHQMAKAAIENAAWELQARLLGQPLWRFVGGTRSEIPTGVSIGIKNSVPELLDAIEREVAAGYQRIKIKIKPGWDVNVLEQVRQRFPDVPLMGDANSAYTLDDLDHLQRFDDFNLTMVEQPLWHDDIYFHARLQRAMRTAVCLDESIKHARDAQQAIEIGACRVINVKLGRVGGFTAAREVHDVTQAHGIPVWCGGMLESGIGRAHNIAMSTLPNFSLPGDVSASRRYWKQDIIEPEVDVSARGTIAAPEGPGLGYEVNHELIRRLTVWEQTFTAGSKAA
jgi:O-succinylbenzoate synthase